VGGLPRYIVQRLLLTIPMLFILLTIVFILLRVMPGNPVLALLGGRNVSPQVIADALHRYGFDRPIHVQYVQYIGQILRGDFGNSINSGRPVLQDLFLKLPATLELAFFSMLIAGILGLTTGLLAATRADRPIDHGIRFFHIGSFAIPLFWLGLMLQIIFAVKLHWLPVAQRIGRETIQSVTGFYIIDSLLMKDPKVIVDVLRHLVLPAVTLGIAQTGLLGRISRASMLEVLDMDYITTARSKGLRERTVILGHALRNALIPIVTVFGLEFAILMGGAVLTETVFSWPGIASFLVNSIGSRDYYAIQGTVVFIALFISVINLIVDLLYSFIDPRVRY